MQRGTHVGVRLHGQAMVPVMNEAAMMAGITKEAMNEWKSNAGIAPILATGKAGLRYQ